MGRVAALPVEVFAQEFAALAPLDDQRPHQVGPGLVQRSHGLFQVIGEPQIIVVQIGNEAATGTPESFVVRPRLVADVSGEVYEVNARVP